jgi:precorrin-3B synthase
MNRPMAKGWCPGALRPMMSGDGLLVRIRPTLGRLNADQVYALCEAADAFGSGLMDLTNRANIQIRGVAQDNFERLLARLDTAGLVDHDLQREVRNNIIVSPLWQNGDDTWRIATELKARLQELPDLPAKFGFAIDAGSTPVLSTVSADIRIERSQSNILIVRADGAASGVPSTISEIVHRIIELCHWFAETGGTQSKRMAQHIARSPLPKGAEQIAPLEAAADILEPGPSRQGPVYGAPLGRMSSSDLANVMLSSKATALRTTPWRLFVLEGGTAIESDAFISDPADHLRRVDACPGSPFCPSSSVDTRTLAYTLARTLSSQADLGGLDSRRLHISGCAKGCARPSLATMTVVGRNGKFDIVRDGCAWDPPEKTGLDSTQVAVQLGGN